MKRKTTKTLLAAVMITSLVLSACDNKPNEPAETTPTVTTAPAPPAANPAPAETEPPVTEPAPITPKSYEPFEFKLYNPLGTGIKRPDGYILAKTYYTAYLTDESLELRIDFLENKALQAKIYEWFDNAVSELEEKRPEYAAYVRANENIRKENQPVRYYACVTNGYIFLAADMLLSSYHNYDAYFYDYKTTAFDLYTGEELSFSDLFFEGEEFMPILNGMIAREAAEPRESGYRGAKREFSGLLENGFGFFLNHTKLEIMLPPKNPYFKFGEHFYLFSLFPHMAVSVPRDMNGLFTPHIEIYENEIWNYEYADVKTRDYYKGNVVYMLLTEYEGVSTEKIDEINSVMLDVLNDEARLSSAYEMLPEWFELIPEGEYERREPNELGIEYSNIRFIMSPHISEDYKTVQFSLGEPDATAWGGYVGWVYDFETLEFIKKVPD